MSANASDFTVHLYREKGLDIENAKDVARIFARNAGPVRIKIAQKSLSLAKDENGDLPWHETFVALRDVRERDKIQNSDFIYLLTRTPNELNWYAVEDENCMRNGFGHVGDFNWVTTSPPSVISAHYVLKAIFNALVDEADLDWKSLWHDKPRGCFYDFCEEKQQLNLKLRTADICGDCMQVFKEIPIPEPLIAQTVQIMEESRLTALNTALFLSRPNSFDAWPFPVAVTRHKAIQAKNMFMKFMLLLDHFDCLVRYLVLANLALNKRQADLPDRPSLGWWVAELGRLVQTNPDLRYIQQIEQEERIVHLRNETRGHGWLQSDEASYAPMATRLENAISEIEKAAEAFLRRYQLVVPTKIEVNKGVYTVSCSKLVGSNLLHPVSIESFDVPPHVFGVIETQKVYIFDSLERKYTASGATLQFTSCPDCRVNRLLLADGGDTFIDAFAGHRVTLECVK